MPTCAPSYEKKKLGIRYLPFFLLESSDYSCKILSFFNYRGTAEDQS
jgi:hypothetical protein